MSRADYRYMEGQADQQDLAPYDSIHGTNDYITQWDAMFANPSDVFADGYDKFADENFAVNDDYPHQA
jgi:hypothetical protein